MLNLIREVDYVWCECIVPTAKVLTVFLCALSAIVVIMLFLSCII